MLILLSPAKKLLNFNEQYLQETTSPIFNEQTDELIQYMKALSVTDIAKLMHLSTDLAELNYQRYQLFSRDNCLTSDGYPAIFLFKGDVYKSLQAEKWNNDTLAFAQHHLRILSGLYGLLRPLDKIQPYRLEMGTKLSNSRGKNLYEFWQAVITHELNQQLESHANPCIINLASTEYFSAINVKALSLPLLTIHFKEKSNNQIKVVGIHAKKARGSMANYILQHQMDSVEKIKQFDLLNYNYCEKSSDEHNLTFIRES